MEPSDTGRAPRSVGERPANEDMSMVDRTLDNFELDALQDTLGKGSFGIVQKIRRKGTEKVYALKTMRKEEIIDGNLIDQVELEIQVQRNLKHMNVLRLYRHFEDADNIYLLLEFCAKGELYQMLRTQKNRRFPEALACKFFVQVAMGLRYLHLDNIVHRDIKPENLLVNHDDVLKIADFGWCAVSSTLRTTFCGTLDYLAPEMIQGRGHDSTLDIWSAGVLLYEMIVGAPPFQSTSHALLIARILSLELRFPSHIISPAAQDLVSRLLRTQQHERLPLADATRHVWIREHMDVVKMGYPAEELTQLLTETGESPDILGQMRSSPPEQPLMQPSPQLPGHPLASNQARGVENSNESVVGSDRIAACGLANGVKDQPQQIPSLLRTGGVKGPRSPRKQTQTHVNDSNNNNVQPRDHPSPFLHSRAARSNGASHQPSHPQRSPSATSGQRARCTTLSKPSPAMVTRELATRSATNPVSEHGELGNRTTSPAHPPSLPMPPVASGGFACIESTVSNGDRSRTDDRNILPPDRRCRSVMRSGAATAPNTPVPRVVYRPIATATNTAAASRLLDGTSSVVDALHRGLGKTSASGRQDSSGGGNGASAEGRVPHCFPRRQCGVPSVAQRSHTSPPSTPVQKVGYRTVFPSPPVAQRSLRGTGVGARSSSARGARGVTSSDSAENCIETVEALHRGLSASVPVVDVGEPSRPSAHGVGPARRDSSRQHTLQHASSQISLGPRGSSASKSGLGSSAKRGSDRTSTSPGIQPCRTPMVSPMMQSRRLRAAPSQGLGQRPLSPSTALSTLQPAPLARPTYNPRNVTMAGYPS